jgi:hypothetical protein
MLGKLNEIGALARNNWPTSYITDIAMEKFPAK